MNCPYCGKALNDGANFCPFCGAQFNQNNTYQAVPNQQNFNNYQQNPQPQYQNMPYQNPKSNNKALLITLISIIAVLLIAGGVLLFFFFNPVSDDTKNDKDTKENISTSTNNTTTVTTTPAYGYDNSTNNTNLTVEQVLYLLNSNSEFQKNIKSSKDNGIDILITTEGNSIAMNMNLTKNIPADDLAKAKSELQTPEGIESFQNGIHALFNESNLRSMKESCPSLESINVYVHDENSNLIYSYTLPIS